MHVLCSILQSNAHVELVVGVTLFSPEGTKESLGPAKAATETIEEHSCIQYIIRLQ